MEIIPVVPRGYCQGVVRAIQIAKATVQNNPNVPVSMLGMIVHNRHVVEACNQLGIRCLDDPNKTRLQLLDDVNEGIVILTAHGTSDKVKEKAKEKNLKIVDATCPDVIRTHELVKNHCQVGDVIYIGKKNHPEAEGVVSLHERVHMISTFNDIQNLPDNLENILITNQTTLSLLDTEQLIAECIKRYPEAKATPEICNATTIRQQAVIHLQNIDVLIVVGDPHSNNSNQLKEIGKKIGIANTYLIESCQELEEKMVKGYQRIAVTSGSSTPNILTNQVIDFLKEYALSEIWKTAEKLKVTTF